MAILPFHHTICGSTKYNKQVVRYLHQKYDGHRVTALRQPKNPHMDLNLYTKSKTNLFPEIYTRAKHHKIWPWLERLLSLPPKSSIDGELYVPGGDSSDVKTAIIENDPTLRFAAFAVPWYSGTRLYSNPLNEAMEIATHHDIEFLPFIDLDEEKEIDVKYWEDRIRPETEGWVAKQFHYAFWYKIKKVYTIDVVVTGFTKGKGKYEGKVGSLKGSVLDPSNQWREICLASGMTDEIREQISPSDFGRVFEVSYQKVMSLGRLRHPIFKRWREDKEYYECTMGQDPTLLKYWSNER